MLPRHRKLLLASLILEFPLLPVQELLNEIRFLSSGFIGVFHFLGDFVADVLGWMCKLILVKRKGNITNQGRMMEMLASRVFSIYHPSWWSSNPKSTYQPHHLAPIGRSKIQLWAPPAIQPSQTISQAIQSAPSGMFALQLSIIVRSLLLLSFVDFPVWFRLFLVREAEEKKQKIWGFGGWTSMKPRWKRGK